MRWMKTVVASAFALALSAPCAANVPHVSSDHVTVTVVVTHLGTGEIPDRE